METNILFKLDCSQNHLFKTDFAIIDFQLIGKMFAFVENTLNIKTLVNIEGCTCNFSSIECGQVSSLQASTTVFFFLLFFFRKKKKKLQTGVQFRLGV
jgi:hypothetical protein